MLPISTRKILIYGWSITPAQGGQFVLAKVENTLRRDVVSLVRPEGVSLSDFSNNGGYISEGCQTGPNGAGSYARYLDFMKTAKGFSGNYYLRSNLIEGGNLGTANVIGSGSSKLAPLLNVNISR